MYALAGGETDNRIKPPTNIHISARGISMIARAFSFQHQIPITMNNPIDHWPWAILLGLAVFSFFILGPIISGLLLIVFIIAMAANLLSPR
jgi:hypothetical protein